MSINGSGIPGAASSAELPGFAKVEDTLATGRRPTPAGFDLLKKMGYRTVVYAYASGVDTSAARDLATKRDLSFVAIETTPEKLDEAAATFNKTIADRSNRPTYVYDDTGLRAGALWYLYFRTVGLQSAEVARIRARALGLTDEGDEAKAFWIAISK